MSSKITRKKMNYQEVNNCSLEIVAIKEEFKKIDEKMSNKLDKSENITSFLSRLQIAEKSLNDLIQTNSQDVKTIENLKICLKKNSEEIKTISSKLKETSDSFDKFDK